MDAPPLLPLGVPLQQHPAWHVVGPPGGPLVVAAGPSVSFPAPPQAGCLKHHHQSAGGGRGQGPPQQQHHHQQQHQQAPPRWQPPLPRPRSMQWAEDAAPAASGRAGTPTRVASLLESLDSRSHAGTATPSSDRGASRRSSSHGASDSSDEADVLLMHSGGRWPHAWAAASAEPAFSSPAPRPCSLPGTPTSTAVPCGPFRAPSPTPSAGAWHGYGCGYEQSSSSSTSSSPPSSGPPSCSSLAAAAPASCGGTPATAFAAAAMRASSSSNRLSLSGCPPALLVAPPPQKQFSQPLPPLPSSPQQQQVPRRQRLLAASFLTDLVARLLLCLYFFNSAWQAWEMVQRSDVPFPDLTIGEAFPVIKSVALLPCVALVLLGYGVCTSSALLLLDVLGESCLLLHAEIRDVVVHGEAPHALAIKRLAVCGAVTAMLASSFQQGSVTLQEYKSRMRRSMSGMLVDVQSVSYTKCLSLLLGRVAIGALLLLLGLRQLTAGHGSGARRLLSLRHWTEPSADIDSGDNNWLLLELALVAPFLLGWKTRSVCRVLAVVLAAEALLCWPFWTEDWLSWHYAAVARCHFVCNMAVAGGLMVMQKAGAGSFAIDAMRAKHE